MKSCVCYAVQTGDTEYIPFSKGNSMIELFEAKELCKRRKIPLNRIFYIDGQGDPCEVNSKGFFTGNAYKWHRA